MPRLGTYTTFDCPTKEVEKAFDWLQNEFSKIEGYVRLVSNPHDFGSYTSFEIDYPLSINDIDMDDDEISDEDYDKKDKWHEKANEIEEKYSKKFEKYL